MAQLGFPYFNYDEVYPNKAAMVKAIKNKGDWSSRIGRYLMVNYYYNGVDGTADGDDIYNYNASQDNLESEQDSTFERKNWHGTVWQIVKTVKGLQLLFIGDTSVGENLTPNKMAITAENGRITSLDELQGNSTYASTDYNGILKEEFLQPGSYLRVVPNDNGKGTRLESVNFPPNSIFYTNNPSSPSQPPTLQGYSMKSDTLLYIGSKSGSDGFPEIKEVNLNFEGEGKPSYSILCSGLAGGNGQLRIFPFNCKNSFLYMDSIGALQGKAIPINSNGIEKQGFFVWSIGQEGQQPELSYNSTNDMIYLETQDKDGSILEYNKIEHKKVYDGSGEDIFDSNDWQQGLISTSSDGTSTTQYWGFEYPYYEIDDYGHVTKVSKKEVRVSNINLEETGILVEMDY